MSLKLHIEMLQKSKRMIISNLVKRDEKEFTLIDQICAGTLLQVKFSVTSLLLQIYNRKETTSKIQHYLVLPINLIAQYTA